MREPFLMDKGPHWLIWIGVPLVPLVLLGLVLIPAWMAAGTSRTPAVQSTLSILTVIVGILAVAWSALMVWLSLTAWWCYLRKK